MKTLTNYFKVSPQEVESPQTSKNVSSRKRHKKVAKCNKSEADEVTTPKNGVRNAFQFMMENRNKSIGKNEEGHELVENKEEEVDDKTIKQTRRKLLETWSEEKGAGKRKREYIETGIVITKKLEKRARRLKDMLNIDDSASEITPVVVDDVETSPVMEDVETPPIDNVETPVLSEKRVLRPRKAKQVDLIVSDSEEEEIVNKRAKKRTRRLYSSDDEVKMKRRTSKIAPVFLKATPKPKEDPAVVEARRQFLLSGIPEGVKKDIFSKQNGFDDDFADFNPFPSISHVQQKDNNSLWNLPSIDFNYHSDKIEFKTNFNTFPSIFLEKQQKLSAQIVYDSIENKKKIVEIIKRENPNYPVYKSFKILKHKSRTKEDNLLWSEKYKANKSDEIVGNSKAITTLKNWLTSWVEGKQSQDDSDSDSDFDDGSSGKWSSVLKNVVILSGPCGSGKSSAVYALCNELEFNVLEINASSRRTGKTLIEKVREATQSHQLEKNENQGSQKLCVFLVEDVDIVFEQDDGFISALSQIIQTSKRPIILTTTDENLNLQKISNYPKINFLKLTSKILNVWLELLLLVEIGVNVNKHILGDILDFNQGDVRRTLLYLQFWGNFKIDLTTKGFCLKNLWPANVLNNNNKSEERLKRLGLQSDVAIKDNNVDKCEKSLKEISNILETISVTDLLVLNNRKININTGNCLNLSPSLDEYNQNSGNLNELSEFLLNCSLKSTPNSCPQLEKKWLKKLLQCDILYTNNLPLSESLKTNGIQMDYLPNFRTIARSELKRLTTNTKRGNRFYNYLNNFGVNCNDADWKLSCNILQIDS